MKKKRIIIYIIITIILIILVVGYGIYQMMENNQSIILDKSKNIVYTSYESKTYNQRVPCMNVIEVSDEVNQSINDFVSPYLEQEAIKIDYHYQLNGNILSLLIELEKYEHEGSPEVEFSYYIVNLKKKKILKEDEILSMFDLKKETLVKLIDNRFQEYFKDELEKNIISKNTTYEEFLREHEITSFGDQLYYDIQDGHLRVYIDYNSFASIESEYYFSDIGYSFEVY